LPIGVVRALDEKHLNVYQAKVVYDLGSGLSKLVLQAFLQYPHLHRVVGIELSRGRTTLAFNAVKRLHEKLGNKNSELHISEDIMRYNMVSLGRGDSSDIDDVIDDTECKESIVQHDDADLIYERHSNKDNVQSQTGNDRCNMRTSYGKPHMNQLELRCGNLFETYDVSDADIVICETKLPSERHYDLLQFLLKHMKIGSRILTYEDLEQLWISIQQHPAACKLLPSKFPFTKIEANIPSSDRFETTWSTINGAHFHLYTKTS
jgi:hypothetical protein